MDSREFTRRLFNIERELRLFDDRVEGILWWDPVRFDVSSFAYRSVTGQQVPPPGRPSLLKRIAGRLKRYALQLRLWILVRTRAFDIIVFRAPRQLRNGRYSDVAVDPVARTCADHRQLVIDTYPIVYHRSLRAPRQAHPDCRSRAGPLAAAFSREYGIDIGPDRLADIIHDSLQTFLGARAIYHRLFRKVRPRLVLMSQNGIGKGMFAAAHELSIPCVEVQHGLTSYAHRLYSYCPSINYASQQTFPVAFLTLSKYWQRYCHYPARRLIEIGNDDFHVTRLPSPKNGDIVFITADIYHSTLLPWVVETARRLPDRSIKYKLHPNQQSDTPEIRRILAPHSNVEVVDGSVSARGLLAKAAVFVLIQSTTAYEALQAGRNVCVLPLMNFGVHADLLSLPVVTVTPTVDALVEALERHHNPSSGPGDVFFAAFDASIARKFLLDIAAAPPARAVAIEVQDGLEKDAAL